MGNLESENLSWPHFNVFYTKSTKIDVKVVSRGKVTSGGMGFSSLLLDDQRVTKTVSINERLYVCPAI